jgi:diaminopimelate epimerase
MTGPAGEVVNERLEVDGESLTVTCLSLGNPHCVIFTDAVEKAELEKVGPAVENHPAFPERTNVEFVEILDRHNVRMRIWERGAGETLASGTGSTAAAVASLKCGHTDTPVSVNLKLGVIEIDWRLGESASMTGPASYVFQGEILDDVLVQNTDSTDGRSG